jgi:hypothetical protein
VRLIEGDVRALRATGVGSDFRFLLDFGLFHDELTDEQREAMGREVSAVAAPGATMLMLVWAPGRRRLLPRGASRGDIEAAYPAWKVIDEEALVDEPRAPRVFRVHERDHPGALVGVAPEMSGTTRSASSSSWWTSSPSGQMNTRWAPAPAKALRRCAQTSAGPIGSESSRSDSTGRPSSGARTSASTRSATARSSVT